MSWRGSGSGRITAAMSRNPRARCDSYEMVGCEHAERLAELVSPRFHRVSPPIETPVRQRASKLVFKSLMEGNSHA